jgi:hypothetical protein
MFKKIKEFFTGTKPEVPTEAPYKVEAIPAGTEAAIIASASPANVQAEGAVESPATVVVVPEAVVPEAVVPEAVVATAPAKAKAPAKPKAVKAPKTPAAKKAPAAKKPRAPKAK